MRKPIKGEIIFNPDSTTNWYNFKVVSLSYEGSEFLGRRKDGSSYQGKCSIYQIERRLKDQLNYEETD